MRFRRLSFRLAACLLLAVAACSSSDAVPEQVQAPALSEAPPEGDSGKTDSYTDEGYSIEGMRAWSIVGNELTKGHDTLELAVTAPEGVRVVDLWLDGANATRLERDGQTFRASVPIGSLQPGKHTVLLASDGARTAFAKLEFQRSHPVYVFVSNDWDDPDNADDRLARQEQLHANHAELKITHFVGPYTYTDPEVTTERADLLTAWVKGMRDTYGDEIGLHIHPWCSFVNTTTVPCRTTPSFAKAEDTTGYTVILSSYTRDEMDILVKRAKEIFEQHGLGVPTSFRAGGWTVEIHTLQALAENGFVADGSPANWARMEEWENEYGATIYQWNKEHWVTINDTTQPWYPSEADILESAPPVVPILEVPDNGLLVDYVRADEMIEVFTKNWDGTAAQTPRMVSIGYHPVNFGDAYLKRIDAALTHIDQFLASQDKGPVYFVRGSDLPKVWKLPQ